MANSKHFSLPAMTSTLGFIGGRDKSFYIPAYQRHFSWKNEKIDRLFEDIVEDISQRLLPVDKDSDIDTVSFIGTVLCQENTKLSDIYPQVRDQVPDGVHSVIDGQQRLSVLIVLSIILHDYIRTSSKGPEGGWLHKKCLEKMESLSSMFRTTKPFGDVPIYPKMIRALDDQWSTESNQKQYWSPLSHYEFCYAEFLMQQEDGLEAKFKYESGGVTIPDLDDRLRDAHKNFLRAVTLINKWVRQICARTGKADAFPKAQDILKNRDLLQDLFNTSDIAEGAVDYADNNQCNTVRAILFATYVMKKVYFVSLITKDENYAFDIFDSLNTTGEPLTAYETFRPEVIRLEGLKEFRDSESRKHLEKIDGHLEKVSTDQKPKRTSEMLVTFALAESGYGLSKKLHVQRKYLKEMYDKCKGSEGLFTRHLMHVSDVWQLWSSPRPDILAGLGIEAQSIASPKVSEANFCLQFLRDAGHTIALALIARFYSTVKIQCDNRESGRVNKAEEMCDVVKAVAAFFAIWRSSRESTEGIDNCYREMVKQGFSRIFESQIRGGTPSLVAVQKKFCGLLKEDGGASNTKIGSKSIWIAESKDVPIHRVSRKVAKFVLLAAAHNTMPDSQDTTRMKKARDGAGSSLMNHEIWGDDDYATIEHVCPQSFATDKIHPDRLHRIGNLTLLPRDANSILGDHLWPKKQVIYRLLSAMNDDELRTAAIAAKAAGISEESIDKLGKHRYLPMTKTVAEYDDFYSLDRGPDDKMSLRHANHIESRSENILENAWVVLSEWLNFNEL